MSKRRFLGGMVAVLAVATMAGTLIASNMGFKLNYTLIGQGQATPEGAVSADGTNELALPDNRQSGLNTAKGLLTDIGASAQSIQKLIRSNNSLCVYTGVKGTPCTSDFALNSGEGYRVKVGGSNVSYVIVGSDNPSLTYTLIGQGQTVPEGGTSADGTNSYAFQYHSTSATAKDILTELGAGAQSVQKLIRGNNSLCVYTGVKGTPCTTNFNLTPGESYRVKVGATNVSYTPSHY